MTLTLARQHTTRGRLIVPAVIVLACTVLQIVPGVLALMEYTRAGVEAGQWWRLLTGNFVHFGWGHFAGDLAAFLALCLIARCRGRDVLLVVGACAVAVGTSVHLWAPHIHVFRGISGVYYGVMTFALIGMICRDRGRKGLLWAAILGALIFKTAYELATGTLLVQTCLPEGIAVVGISHLAGMVMGATVAGAKKCPLTRDRGGLPAPVTVCPLRDETAQTCGTSSSGASASSSLIFTGFPESMLCRAATPMRMEYAPSAMPALRSSGSTGGSASKISPSSGSSPPP